MGRFGNPDIVIFYIGCNDWGSSNSPVADYGTWTVNDLIVDDSGYSSTQTLNDFGAAYSLMLAKKRLAMARVKRSQPKKSFRSIKPPVLVTAT